MILCIIFCTDKLPTLSRHRGNGDSDALSKLKKRYCGGLGPWLYKIGSLMLIDKTDGIGLPLTLCFLILSGCPWVQFRYSFAATWCRCRRRYGGSGDRNSRIFNSQSRNAILGEISSSTLPRATHRYTNVRRGEAGEGPGLKYKQQKGFQSGIGDQI